MAFFLVYIFISQYNKSDKTISEEKHMNKIKLYNNIEMPQFGLGTFLVKEGESAYNTVKYALEIGYRHIDTAQMYGNEESVGQAIKDSNVKREDIWITTKQARHMNLEHMKKAFQDSLDKLQTDYVDLYLIHWPNHNPKINRETWAYFESLYQEGKCRAIGISNFQIHMIEDLMTHANILPMVNQVELHPGLSQVPLKAYLDKKGIAIESYGPFMKGGIFEGRYADVLAPIANRHHASIAQIVIAWGLARGIIMIPKSVTPKRIKENYDAQNIKLSKEEVNMIDDLNRGNRVYTDPDNSPWGAYID